MAILGAVLGFAAAGIGFYILLGGLQNHPDGSHGMTIDVRTSGSNWSLEIRGVQGGTVPATTYLVIRSPQGVYLLYRIPFANLTLANWDTNRAIFEDENPGVAEVHAGDSLLVETATYPVGCMVEVYDPSFALTAVILK